MFRTRHQLLHWHRITLMWFVLSLGFAILAPLVHAASMELVCSAGGALKLVNSGDGADDDSSKHSTDCTLCLAAAAPPSRVTLRLAPTLPLGRALQPIVAARIAAATAAPFPARGPPAFL